MRAALLAGPALQRRLAAALRAARAARPLPPFYSFLSSCLLARCVSSCTAVVACPFCVQSPFVPLRCLRSTNEEGGAVRSFSGFLPLSVSCSAAPLLPTGARPGVAVQVRRVSVPLCPFFCCAPATHRGPAGCCSAGAGCVWGRAPVRMPSKWLGAHSLYRVPLQMPCCSLLDLFELFYVGIHRFA